MNAKDKQYGKYGLKCTKNASSAKSELLYVYIYNDDSQSLIASAYRVDEKVVGNVKAGVSNRNR